MNAIAQRSRQRRRPAAQGAPTDSCGRGIRRRRIDQRRARRGARSLLGATSGLSETGASGPTGNRYEDAPGHACIAVSGPVEAAITVETGSSEREANMWAFARRALELLESCLLSIR